jgi:hypothetical protein
VTAAERAAIIERAQHRPCPRCGAARGEPCSEPEPMPRHLNVAAVWLRPLDEPHAERYASTSAG